MRCGSNSPRAVSLKARCTLTSMPSSFALRCDPHSIACSVLENVGMRSFFTNLNAFIDRCPDEGAVGYRCGRISAAEYRQADFWLRAEAAEKALCVLRSLCVGR